MKKKELKPELVARICTEFNHYFRLNRKASPEDIMKMLRGVPNPRRVFSQFKNEFLKSERNSRHIYYMVNMGFILEPKMFWKCYDSKKNSSPSNEIHETKQEEIKEEYKVISLDELFQRLENMHISKFSYSEKIGLKEAIKQKKYKFLEEKIIFEEL